MRDVTDRAVRARNLGKEAVASRTFWVLEIVGVRFRCLRNAKAGAPKDQAFYVELRWKGKWEFVWFGTDPVRMLRATACAPLVAEQLAKHLKETGAS